MNNKMPPPIVILLLCFLPNTQKLARRLLSNASRSVIPSSDVFPRILDKISKGFRSDLIKNVNTFCLCLIC